MAAWQIRERCFREVVAFRVGALDLSPGDAVFVLDLAMSSEFAVKMLAMEGAAEIDFPGNSWSVGLVRSGDAVSCRSATTAARRDARSPIWLRLSAGSCGVSWTN